MIRWIIKHGSIILDDLILRKNTLLRDNMK